MVLLTDWVVLEVDWKLIELTRKDESRRSNLTFPYLTSQLGCDINNGNAHLGAGKSLKSVGVFGYSWYLPAISLFSFWLGLLSQAMNEGVCLFCWFCYVVCVFYYSHCEQPQVQHSSTRPPGRVPWWSLLHQGPVWFDLQPQRHLHCGPQASWSRCSDQLARPRPLWSIAHRPRSNQHHNKLLM